MSRHRFDFDDSALMFGPLWGRLISVAQAKCGVEVPYHSLLPRHMFLETMAGVQFGQSDSDELTQTQMQIDHQTNQVRPQPLGTVHTHRAAFKRLQALVQNVNRP